MAFKMNGWSAFTKEKDWKIHLKGKTTKAEKEKQDSLALEEAKKKMSKWELADYEKIQREKYHPTGVPRYVPRNKKWEKQPDGEYKLVAKTRGRSTGKTSETQKIKDPSKRPKKRFKKPYWLGTTTWP